MPKNLHKPGSPQTGLHSWASSTEPPTPKSELKFSSESQTKYKSAPFLVRLADPKMGPRNPRHLLKSGSKNKATKRTHFKARKFSLQPCNLQLWPLQFSRKTTISRTVEAHCQGTCFASLFGISFGDALCAVQLCLHRSHVEPHWKRNLHWNQNEMEAAGGRWRPHWKCNLQCNCS